MDLQRRPENPSRNEVPRGGGGSAVSPSVSVNSFLYFIKSHARIFKSYLYLDIFVFPSLLNSKFGGDF